jgi:hypothetical protein
MVRGVWHLSVTPPLKGGEREDWDEKNARAVGRKIPHLPPQRAWSVSSPSAHGFWPIPICHVNTPSL